MIFNLLNPIFIASNVQLVQEEKSSPSDASIKYHLLERTYRSAGTKSVAGIHRYDIFSGSKPTEYTQSGNGQFLAYISS
jgi:hypothetical protein